MSVVGGMVPWLLLMATMVVAKLSGHDVHVGIDGRDIEVPGPVVVAVPPGVKELEVRPGGRGGAVLVSETVPAASPVPAPAPAAAPAPAPAPAAEGGAAVPVADAPAPAPAPVPAPADAPAPAGGRVVFRPVLPPGSAAVRAFGAAPPGVKVEYKAMGWSRPRFAPPEASKFKVQHLVRAVNPPSIDMRAMDSPIWDQGQEGSCTAHALGGVMAFHWRNNVAPKDVRIIMPARQALYYDERAMEGTIGQDVGASVSDGAAILSMKGVGPESDWPYSSPLSARPPARYYADALPNRVPALASVDMTDLDEIRTALANHRPIAFGFDAYSSLYDVGAGGSYVPRGQFLGGHAVMAVGYDDGKKSLIVSQQLVVGVGREGLFPDAVFVAGFVGVVGRLVHPDESAAASRAGAGPGASGADAGADADADPVPDPVPAPVPVPSPSPSRCPRRPR
jgi:hypothetical protein